MKTLLSLMLLMLFFACKNTSEQNVEKQELTEDVTYSFKVNGLNDSLVSDSVSKIIFMFPGLEEMTVDRTDSIISIRYKLESIEIEQFKEELENRGVEILQVIK